MTIARRMWDSPRLIPILAVLTGISLIGMAFTVLSVLAIDTQQERDRVASDIGSCNRVNLLRQQVIDLGDATSSAFVGILDVATPPPSGDPERDARVAAFEAEIAPILADMRTAVEGIELTDCEQVVPGSSPPPK